MARIAIIGGGASGIAAAITAAERGAQVTLLEGGKRIGHSILASGNGRCNFSNKAVSPQRYWNAGFVRRVFEACPPQRVLHWFAEDLGLLWVEEAQGRMYPAANKASSVLDVLRFRIDELGVRVQVESPVSRVRQDGGIWLLDGGGRGRFDAVIVACGGQVARGLLPDGCAVAPARPRLCPLRTDAGPLKGLDNVRARACVRVMHQGSPVFEERGEVQFRPYGVSGVVAFNASRFVQVGDVLELDLVPDMEFDDLAANLARRMRRFPARGAEQLLAGLALPAVARAALRQCGDSRDPQALACALKRFALRVSGFEVEKAQVTRGGVKVGQVDADTLRLAGCRGLHVTGEALDVDGPCGGYNLHWAWTTGILAGFAAAGEERDA